MRGRARSLDVVRTACHHERWRQQRGQFLHRRATLQRHREAFVVVPVLPRGEGMVGGLEVLTGVASPELFVVDPMAPFDLPVLFGAPRPDVAHSNAEVLTREGEEERKLGTVVDL
jgi:hypothetical protein